MRKKESFTMFRTILGIFVLIMLASAANAVEMNYSNTNIESQHADIYVSVLKYEPYPVAPGEYFTLWLKIENKGNLEAPDLSFKLNPSYPFSFDSNEVSNRHIGKLGTYQSAVISYKVRVDEKAVEGDTFLQYEYQTAANRKAVTNTVQISVQTPDSILSVASVKTEPSTIAPGEKSTVEISLKNSADSYLRFVSINLGVYTQVNSNGVVSFVELPFTPVGEGSGKTIYQLGPREEKKISFTIVANPDAESKPYKIPLQVNYFDELGKNYSRTEIVGVIVGSEPELYAIVESENAYSKGKTSELPIKFVNKGTGEVKFLNVQLENSDYYKIVSADNYYLGKIDSDDYDTATFKINVQKIKDKKIEVPVSYTYRDGNNNEYSKKETLILDVYSASELGQGSGGSGWTIVIAIIVIGVIYWQYKKWAKGKKKKREE